MNEKPKITLEELYNLIASQMTPEVGLKRLLASALLTYEKLKFPSQEEAVHPVIIISMAAMDMGWGFIIENAEDQINVRGLVVGDEDYMKKFQPRHYTHDQLIYTIELAKKESLSVEDILNEIKTL